MSAEDAAWAADLIELDKLITRAEKAAMAKAMLGLWSSEDDEYLSALYEVRRAMRSPT